MVGKGRSSHRHVYKVRTVSSENLKQRTAKGLFWAVLNSGTTQILNLVIGIFLARLLTPEDYGIVGLLTVFTAIAGDLQSSGFTQGLVNIHRPTVRDYNSVFSFNVVMSILMYTILFFCSPLIADYFHQPCLTTLSRFVFLGFLISSLGIAHGGYMTKNMMNREIAAIGAVALVVSGCVGITLALFKMAYWALAWQQVTYITVLNIGRYYYVKDWRPRLSLDFGPVRQMFSFAVKILVTKIVNTVSNNILTVIFGRLFPIRQVGNFSQAFKWDTMASSLVTNTMGQLAQTVLVESGETTERELRVFRKMLRFTCFLAMPIMFGLALVSDEFIRLAIGTKWLDCVPLLQILCLSGAFLPLYTMYQQLAISRGRSDVYMWLSIGQIALQIGVIMAFYKYGIVTMVIAYSAFIVMWLLPWHAFCGKKMIGYTWMSMLRDVMPSTLVALGVMILTYFSTTWLGGLVAVLALPLPLLLLRVVIAAVLYYAVMKLIGDDILGECEAFVMKKMNKRT